MRSKIITTSIMALVLIWVVLTIGKESASMVGKKAAEFTIKTVEGAELSFKPSEHKLTIIDFWATWCVPCVRSLPELNSLSKDYKDKDLSVIGVCLDCDDLPKVKAFLKRSPLEFPVVCGNEKVVADYGKVESIPRTFLIDQEGNIVLDLEGFDGPGLLRKKIQSLLGGEKDNK